MLNIRWMNTPDSDLPSTNFILWISGLMCISRLWVFIVFLIVFISFPSILSSSPFITSCSSATACFFQSFLLSMPTYNSNNYFIRLSANHEDIQLIGSLLTAVYDNGKGSNCLSFFCCCSWDRIASV
jgi:hypothetical protein